ncbi:glycosyltransferase family 4 protein [Bradyrhizobium sp.]|uniref:glycosyltransferase family 4 protein n=1 Tax=Bradyrhizobium sp. TaxID=376 RepID=UPI001C2842C1|nr:glycosyltransferase family 4 protein [Pseudomonadota bacterium]
MPKILIITNDFPPRVGGIQSFLHTVAMQLSKDVAVYAPAWRDATSFDRSLPFPVFRHPTSLMLPVWTVRRRALAIMAGEGCDSILFGAAAPLGLLAPALRRAGARRMVAITHGHEAGWAAVPLARGLLRHIGDSVDAVTYLGDYFHRRLADTLSPAAAARMRRLGPGVDTERFRPGCGGAIVRARLGLGTRPVILCVSRLVPRKGQDMLIRAMPMVLKAVSEAVLVLVGEGPYAGKLRRLARRLGLGRHVLFTGEISGEELPAYYDAADIFAMPCRTRRAGLDVEGLGIVFLEAAASGLPVIAGDSGGAPDAVLEGETGFVVSGRDLQGLADRLKRLLVDPALAKTMGTRGRAWVEGSWSRDVLGRSLRELLEL